MLILGIDSSTEVAAIALMKENELVGEINLSLHRRHSERLMPNINHLFNELNYDINDIDGIAVTVGPGSFTGLRIGISTVKGFAQALSVPVIGLSTLDVIAFTFNYLDGLVVPMIDARRNRVYTSLYNMKGKGKDIKERKLWEEKALSIDELLNRLTAYDSEGSYYLTGNGVEVYKSDLQDQKIDLILTLPFMHKPRGGAVAQLGQYLLKRGNNSNIAQLVPNYLKKPQAEINFKKIGD